jgi:hypothetical protein
MCAFVQAIDGIDVPTSVVRHAELLGREIRTSLPEPVFDRAVDITRADGAVEGVRLLAPAVYAIGPGEARGAFAFNEPRAALWDHMIATLRELRSEGEVTPSHVVGAGSYFASDRARPGDIDLAILNWWTEGPNGWSRAMEWSNMRQDGFAEAAPIHLYDAFLAKGDGSGNQLGFYARMSTDRTVPSTESDRVPVGQVLLATGDLLG